MAMRPHRPTHRRQKMAALIASGAAPDLIHLTCPFDVRTKKFRSEIPVDAVRRLRAFFFRTTSIANGWRVAIVDSADALSFSAQNALLKILARRACPQRCARDAP